MKIIHKIEDLRRALERERSRAGTIGLVPTMGALHEGHLSLIRKAREASDIQIVSLFVNPTQFAPDEDFKVYPRNPDHDAELCRREKVHYLFAPDNDEMYPSPPHIRFEIDELTSNLCGRSRPDHFQGVLQVITKLFNIIRPDVAVFGQKDIQQFVLIERMVEELNFDIRILMGETVRGQDGLALSSRNRYLSGDERARAPELYRSLSAIRESIMDDRSSWETRIVDEKERLSTKGFVIDYIEVVRYKNLQIPVRLDAGEKYIIAGAVFLGATRLIDNILITLN